MDGSVVLGELLASVVPGEAKPLPTLRQSVSEIVLSSEAAKPWPPPGAARNVMTLLPGDGNTEQGRAWESNHPKPSVPPALVVGAAADASPLAGEAASAATKEAAVDTRVGDAANVSCTALLQHQGSSKEAPTLRARGAVGAHHDWAGGAGSKGDEEGESSVLPPISSSDCRVAVPVAVVLDTSQSCEAVCCAEGHEGRLTVVEPNLVAIGSPKHPNSSEGQVVGAGEGTGAYTVRDNLEISDSRGQEASRTRPHQDVVEDAPGSSGILAMGACVDGEADSSTADRITAAARPAVAEIGVDEVGARLETSNEAEGQSRCVVGGGVPETEIVRAEHHEGAPDREGDRTEAAPVAMPPSPKQSQLLDVDSNGVNNGTKAGPNQGKVFLPSESFDGAKHGYVFRLGDKGLGFYVDGYVDRPTKAKHAPLHRPWNAGPGDYVIRRGPIGPVHKPFKKIKTRPREGKSAADSNMRSFAARLAAQRNARVFQSTLVERAHAVDAHTVALLENLSDPAFLKENNACDGHGQMLGNNGKPAGKCQTKSDFINAAYRYPGAYDTDGRVIPEEGVPVSNELHRTDEQNERRLTYGFKARQRFRVAHGDLVGAISKKDEGLQNALKIVDPTTLQDIEEQAVSSSYGAGVYRQKGGVGRESGVRGRSSTMARPMKSPEKLRDTFAQSFEAQIRGKDKALMEKVAGLDEEETNQVVDGLGKDAECLPDSWRHNPDNFRKIQKHRKQLIAEIAADRRKVVCPWRPGGRHIAHKPWQAFFPRDHRPPVRSASEGKAGASSGENEGSKTQEWERRRPNRGSGRGRGGGWGGGRPHTAPSRQRKPFIDIIGPRARRMLAAQSPDTPLRNAFSTYSNEPFSGFEPTLRATWQSGQASPSPGPCTDMPPEEFRGGTGHGSMENGRQQRVWSAMVGPPSTSGRTFSSSNTKRPHSAAPKAQSQSRAPPRRPSTASGATNTPKSMDELGKTPPADMAPEREQECNPRTSSQSLDLNVRFGPGVTVLWARLSRPSSDLACKSSTWPSRPRKSGPSHLSRRRDKPSRKVAAETVGAANETPTERDDVGGLAGAVCSTPVVDAERKPGGDARRLSERGEGRGGASLVDLEDRLLASTWKRIHERHVVFRGYAERSRRERVWDPESVLYAEGAGEDHAASPRSCHGGWNEGGERGSTFVMSFPGARDNSRDSRCEKRNRLQCVAADADHPVEMDWKEVDTRRFREAADKIEASLEGKLCAAVTDNGTREHLQDCFREAQYFVASAAALLGCSKDERERINRQRGEGLQIGHYASTVTRLSVLWAAICGVVEIVGMLQRRKELLEVFCSERHRSATQKNKGAATLDDDHDDETAGKELVLATPSSVTAVSPVEPIRTRHYWKRLELAEISTAVAESLKLWLGIVPWRVEVLYGGEKLVSSLTAEEETLPWPPDPESSTGTEDVRVEREGCLSPDDGRTPGQGV